MFGRTMLATAILLLLVSLSFQQDRPEQLYTPTAGQLYTPRVSQGYGNWSAAYAKAREFVCQLTLTEKVNLTTAVGSGSTQGYALGIIPRIGFRGLASDDSPTGVRGADYTSAFAAPLNLAMSWDTSLMYQQYRANGVEHKNKGINYVNAPVCGPLGRVPEGGRIWESYSPDPYLSGIAFANSVAGMQDGGVIAVGKHFVLYEQEHFREVLEWNDYGLGPNITEPYSSNVDDRTLHELYLFPWYDAVRGGMAGCMCSYNQINNTQACANNRLLNDILKGEMGFQGFVTSDDGSQHSGVDSTLGGLDITSPGNTSPNGIRGLGTSFWGPNLTMAVLNGSVPEWRLDDMATRIMAAYYQLGQDKDFPELNYAAGSSGDFPEYGYEYPMSDLDFTQLNYHVDVRDEHAAIIRSVGANSIVMLKNVNNALPLKSPKQLAIIGEDAGPSLFGPNGCSDRGCDNGTLAMGWGSGSCNFPYLVDPLSAIQTRALKDHTEVQYVLDNFATSQIDMVSTQATKCLVFINSDSGEGYIHVGGNYGDRNNLTAWLGGDDLVQRVAANCSDTVVITHSVGPLLLEAWIDHPNVTAVLFAGLPGQESGNSLVDVLYGDVNPSGKLPWTIGKKREDYGVDVEYQPNSVVPQIEFVEGLFIDYRWFDKAGIEPRFEFGFGMSYTSFDYKALNIEKLEGAGAQSNTPIAATLGQTVFSPSMCTTSTSLNPSDYTFPSTVSSLTNYIYPYLASNATVSSTSGSASPTVLAKAAGAQGGNPALYEVLYRVSVKLQNNGTVAGQEVSQLYLDLGNNEPVRQLRGFNKTMLWPGQTQNVTFDIRRKDVVIWDTISQDWVEVTGLGTDIQVYVGSSSRDLRLSGIIEASRSAPLTSLSPDFTVAPVPSRNCVSPDITATNFNATTTQTILPDQNASPTSSALNSGGAYANSGSPCSSSSATYALSGGITQQSGAISGSGAQTRLPKSTLAVVVEKSDGQVQEYTQS